MNISLLVTSGNGPGECRQGVAHVLQRMEAEAGDTGLGFDCMVEPAGHGPKSAVVLLRGAGADRLAQRWFGTIAWQAQTVCAPGTSGGTGLSGSSPCPPPPIRPH